MLANEEGSIYGHSTTSASAFAPELLGRHLVAGFVLVWLLKLLGLEPGVEPPIDSKADIEPPRRQENRNL